MSTVQHQVQLRCYPPEPSQIIHTETAAVNFCEQPLTPPTTPPSPPSACPLVEPTRINRLTELLSSRLRAPTHCPSATSQDIDVGVPGDQLSTLVRPNFYPDLPSLTGASVPAETSCSAELISELEGNLRSTVSASEKGDISQKEKETSQHSVDSNERGLVNIATAAPDKITAAGTKTTRAIIDSVDDKDTSGSPCIQSLSEVVVTEDIASSTIYCRDKKFYVGKMRDLPCPPHVESKWTKEVRPRLIKDLLPVLRTLPRSMSSGETIIEPELCMAGYLIEKASTVSLKPTVWIRCGSKKCRKVIRKAVDDLGYLHSFSQGPVEVRIRGPRPAASSITASSSAKERECLVNANRQLQVQISTSGASACGLRLRVLTETDSEDGQKISTIGGLVKVDGKIYGLTTAHGILDLPRAAGNLSPVFDSSNSAASNSLEPESDSDTSSDTSYSDGHGPHGKGHLGKYDHVAQTLGARFREHIQQLHWKDATFCGPMSFCGCGSVTGGTNDVISSVSDADFALIDMGFSSAYQLHNKYKNPWDLTISINGIKHDEDLNAGEVFLVTGQNQVTVGYLLEGSSLFMNRTVVFNTRKIELDAPLPRGMSGTWVVRDNYLCGVIVAAYDGDPYAHMITADKIFQDIRNFQPSIIDREVTIATGDDIRKSFGRRINDDASAPISSNSKHEDLPSAPPRHTMSPVIVPTRRISFVGTTRNPPRSSRFDQEFFKYQKDERRENKFWLSVKATFMSFWMILRRLYVFLTVLVALIPVPIFMLYRGCRLMYLWWHSARYYRYPRFFDGLITTLTFLFLIASGTSAGLLVYKLIQIVGTHDFLLWVLPFVISVLVCFSILMWLLGLLRARFRSRRRCDQWLHSRMTRNDYDPRMSHRIATLSEMYNQPLNVPEAIEDFEVLLSRC